MRREYEGTKLFGPKHRFDVGSLEGFIKEHVDGFRGPLRLRQFNGGQSNPTYLVTAANERHCVLRRKPSGILLPSAHAVDREYRVTLALHKAGFPVARPLALCEDESIIGTVFCLIDYVPGRIFWDQKLPAMGAAERRSIWDELNRVIALLHSVDYRAVGLEGYGRPNSYVGRQVARWTQQYRSSEVENIEAMNNLIAWLPANIPPETAATIVHGDYRLDNVIFHPFEPRILAVLDWELSTLGEPLADFSYHCLSWHIPHREFRGIAGLDLKALCIHSEREYLELYCERTGRLGIERQHWDFYIAFNLFRIAAILQGIMKRSLDGNAASDEAGKTGSAARSMADLAWKRVEAVLGRAA